jgi:hypothetical protein
LRLEYFLFIIAQSKIKINDNMKITTLRKINIIDGIFFMLLGIAHLFIATPMGIEATKTIPASDSASLTLANIVTAISVFMSGMLVLYSINGYARAEKWSITCSFGCALFMTLVGTGYVVTGPDNPFAYAALLAALCLLLPLILSFKYFAGVRS